MNEVVNMAPVPTNINIINENEDIRILHRVTSLDAWPDNKEATGPFKRIAVIDVETTGTDPYGDEIIEMAAVLIEIDEQGQIVKIIDQLQGKQDLQRSLPAHISQITGIKDENLAGQSIDKNAFTALLQSAHLIIAHNANFDRKFVDRLLPDIENSRWACSMDNVNWLAQGFDGLKMGYLIMQMGYFANSAHSALADVETLINLLNYRLPNGLLVMAEVLANADKPTFMIEAYDVDYRDKDMLRNRKYRWNPQHRNWWIELAPDYLDTEVAWFHGFSNKIKLQVTEINSEKRYIR